jgi:hypothetical protein
LGGRAKAERTNRDGGRKQKDFQHRFPPLDASRRCSLLSRINVSRAGKYRPNPPSARIRREHGSHGAAAAGFQTGPVSSIVSLAAASTIEHSAIVALTWWRISAVRLPIRS